MCFLGSKFTQNALAAGAPSRTPLSELKRSPRPLADFRGSLRGRGNEGKGVLEKGKREGREEKRAGRERRRRREREGREEKRGGRERRRRREREGRGSLRHWR